MSNWLTQPTAWTDQDGHSPPACWDGSNYVVVNTQTTLTLNASVSAGDTISGQFVALLNSGVSASSSTGLITDSNGNTAESVENVAKSITWPLSAGMTDVQLSIDPGYGCSSDTVTISVPIVSYGPFVRQQTTHRAHRHYDSPQVCYLRYESGRPDLSSATIEVHIRNLDRDFRSLRKLTGTGDAKGMVTFTIPRGTFYAGTVGADYQLGLGDRRANNFKFDITVNDVLAYEALLEVV